MKTPTTRVALTKVALTKTTTTFQNDDNECGNQHLIQKESTPGKEICYLGNGILIWVLPCVIMTIVSLVPLFFSLLRLTSVTDSHVVERSGRRVSEITQANAARAG